MKKFRSNLPRRKRSNFSPIIAPKLDATSFIDSSSNLTHDVTISCDSSSRVSTNNKKRSFAASDGGFRRITRSYSKQLENNKAKIEVSEASSCIDLINASSRNVINDINVKVVDIDEVSANNVYGISTSEVTTRSECSVFPLTLVNGRDDGKVTEIEEEENDVVSVNLTVNEGESVYTKRNNDVVSVANKLESINEEITSGKIRSYGEFKRTENEEVENDVFSVSVSSRVWPKVKLSINEGEIRSYVDNNNNNNELGAVKTVNEEQNENDCAESKLISADFDLTCSERFTDEYDDSDETLDDECTDVNMESSEVEFSSEFASSVWYDSGSQFSERSVGDTSDSSTFKLFVAYREKFCKSEFSRSVAEVRKVIELSDRTIKLLRPEDEEYEESYQMLILRERRQLYLHDYSEEYSGMNDYGHLVVQQRLQMVHWVIEESASKEFQKETMFLGVGLLDRFLSKGYFKNKSELEIAGIACLTLATRIEENQPFNSIRQKFFNIGSNEYSRAEVVAMEWLVQEVLNFQCFLPTIYNFLWFYLKAARASQEVDKTAKYLAVLVLLGHEQLCYWPSTVAASLVILACLAENEQSAHQQIAWIYDGSNDKDLPDCIKCLEWLVKYIC